MKRSAMSIHCFSPSARTEAEISDNIVVQQLSLSTQARLTQIDPAQNQVVFASREEKTVPPQHVLLCGCARWLEFKSKIFADITKVDG